MKIMKSVDKKIGDTTYYKYKINLPKKVEETDLLDKELNIILEKEKIIIEEDKALKNKKTSK